MENGESLYFEIKKSAVRDENGNIIGIVGIVDNVSERVRLEKKVEELSIIDVETVAKEVIAGKWVNGEDRKKRLQAAGYDYGAVQRKVNELMR